MSDPSTSQPPQSSSPDDEIAALAIQLEELSIHALTAKEKYAAGDPPDSKIATLEFEAVLQREKVFLQDQKLAQSIAAAVFSDGPVVASLTAQEIQSHEDRQLALRTSTNPEYEEAPRWAIGHDEDPVSKWVLTATRSQYEGSAVDFSDDETESGPSINYAVRQADALDKLNRESQCIACHESLASGIVVKVPCGDSYCTDCLRKRFLLAIKDETLMPVRCHKQPIPLHLIARHLSAAEIQAFDLADLEHSTANKTYCSNRECGRFIPPVHIEPGANKARCTHCDVVTCEICKNRFHEDEDCPNDSALLETRQLAKTMGWKSCYRCGFVVALRSGCNHMTCRCGAEFCYECGTKWRECKCEYAVVDRMFERAEEIVDRDATIDLPVVERQRQVETVQEQLMENHECEHPGLFQRIQRGGRRGFQCEMCGDRHRWFILECRHCSIRLCEDCRNNRI